MRYFRSKGRSEGEAGKVPTTDGLLIENILGTQARGSTGTVLPRNLEEGNIGALNG
jgi:hypothetical protein